MAIEDEVGDKTKTGGGSVILSVWGIAIIAGLISSLIFTVLLQPIAGHLSNATGVAGSKMANWYIDGIYILAVKNPSEQILLGFQTLLAMGFMGFALASIPVVRRLQSLRPDRDSSPRRPSARRTSQNSIAIALYIVVLIQVINGGTMITRTATAMSIRSKFELGLMIVGPFTTEQERLLLTSDWARLKTKSEFVTIMTKMQAIAVKNNTRLRDWP